MTQFAGGPAQTESECQEDAMPEAQAESSHRACEPVYPAEILSDSALGRADLATFGAWMKTLLHLWREGGASLSASACGWAHLWSCTEDEAARVLTQFQELRIADVSRGDGCVTVTCRRLLRREKTRQFHVERMRVQRSGGGRDGDATPMFSDAPPKENEPAAPVEAAAGGAAQEPAPETAPPADADGGGTECEARQERFSRLWGLCKSGALKELTFRKNGVKAKVLDASPDAITLEYPLARLGGRTCRALLLPAEVDVVWESGE